MSLIVRSKIVKIGNSRGVRIPRALLEQAGFTDEVELVVEGSKLIIQPVHAPRHGWEAQFIAIAENKDDRLLDETTSTQWDDDEWTW